MLMPPQMPHRALASPSMHISQLQRQLQENLGMEATAVGSTTKEYTGEMKMTDDFTNLQADFVEACLQAMCLQKG